MPQSTDKLELSSFKQAILNHPKELFYKLRNNAIPELGLYTLAFIKFEHDWQSNRNIDIAVNRINCLCILFLTNIYEMQLNITKNELIKSPRYPQAYDTIFANIDKLSDYQVITKLNEEDVDNIVKVLDQILMYFYDSAIREIYRRYLEELDNTQTEGDNKTPSPSVDGARTPRLFRRRSFRATNTALNKHIECIAEVLNAAHVKPKDFGLENFRELVERKVTVQPAQEPAEKKSHSKKGARCLVM